MRASNNYFQFTLSQRWTEIESILESHLVHFGLNPKEWTLILNRGNNGLKNIKINIQHREDRSLILKGIAQVRPLGYDRFTVYWQLIAFNNT